MRFTITVALLLLLAAAPLLAGEARVEKMELGVKFFPTEHRMEGIAQLHLSWDAQAGGRLVFRLHKGLTIQSVTVRVPKVVELPAVEGEVDGYWRLVSIELPASAAAERVDVAYSGTIYDAVRKSGALGFIVGDDTRGVIGEEGIFLVRGSGWYPLTEGTTAFTSVTIDVPMPLRAVSQGRQISLSQKDQRELSVWGSEVPVDGLAMQAGEYVVTTRDADGVAISTYLFPDHAKHAAFILDQVAEYLEYYKPFLGMYPWPKFDVVENFFTTGYGMPTYTLLGANVVDVMVRMAPRYGNRIPPGFVDHELVHCWWGNYVYPDYQSGNWCEGLTSYCANYLVKETSKNLDEVAHRKKACTNFAIRVDAENDYPVCRFTGKTEDFDNDIGYGKAMMIFHMLRRQVGDEVFWATLKGIIRDFGGKVTSWGDFESAFSAASGQDLGWFFDQWLNRTGAPALRIENVSVTRRDEKLFEVTGEIVQDGEPWRIPVPVTADTVGGEAFRLVEVSAARTPFLLLAPRPPLSVSLDERFHLFQKVPLTEIQPCMNLTLERKDKVFVVPEGAEAYAGLAAMSKARKGGEIRPASQGLPATDAFLFGTPEENPAVARVLDAAGVTVDGTAVTVRGKKLEAEDLWLLLSTRHPDDPNRFVTVFFGTTPAAVARGGRLIFHFGWDGFLVYGGGRPLDRGDFTEIVPSTTIRLPLEVSEERVEATIRSLADPDLGGRGAGTASDAETRKLLIAALRRSGVINIREAPFSFTVRDFTEQDAWSTAHGTLESGVTWRTSFPGAVVPAVFSPEAPDGIRIRKIVKYGGTVDAESLVVLPPEMTAEGLMLLVGNAAASGPAAVAIPMAVLESKDRRILDLVGFPSRLEGDEAARWREASGRQARAATPMIDVGDVPVFFIDDRLLPPGVWGDADARLKFAFETKTIESASLVGVVPDRLGRTSGPAPILSAHFDGLGEGHQGADDNASGVAAVLEAARALSGRQDLLGRPVRIVLFGGEEWGLRGSAALAPTLASRTDEMVNLDTIGARDVSEVFLIGESHHATLAARARACLEAEGLPIGRDIDKYAFSHGSDHWSFFRAGSQVLDIFSGAYRRMNSTADTLDLVDPAKVARIARGVARLMLDLASPDSPVEVPPVTMFEGESAHLENVRMLTRGGENAEAYFDTDGTALCFQGKRGEMPADQIFVMDLMGRGQRMVSNGEGATTCSFLLPGAKRVIYATTMFHGKEPPAPPDRSKGYVWKLHPEFDIVIHDLDGGNLVRLTDEWGYDAEATLSPDGEWIAFTSCRDGDPEVYKMRIDGSELTRLTHSPGYDGGPFFSPDGTKIVWRANRPEGAEEEEKYRMLRDEGLVSPVRLEVFVMDADGKNKRQVTKNGAATFAPYFHPDGKRIIFCSNIATLGKRGMPNFDLWMINLDGTGLTRITSGPDFDGFPMFTHDGKKLVFCSNRDNGGNRDTNVFIADWKD